jgi:hypothetical protein
MVCKVWCRGALVLVVLGLLLMLSLHHLQAPTNAPTNAPTHAPKGSFGSARPSENFAPSPQEAPVLGGAPYLGAHDMSELFREHERVFKPQTLSQSMPLMWRQKEGARPALEPQFAEFANFLVTPESYYSAQAAEGAMRLPQSTRNGNSRTMGLTDLLREKIAPITKSIGREPMPFLDSQARQDYIAAAVGAYV